MHLRLFYVTLKLTKIIRQSFPKIFRYHSCLEIARTRDSGSQFNKEMAINIVKFAVEDAR
jgi:hypothetical protein